MSFFTTDFATISIEKPSNTMNMTAEEIVAYGTKHFRQADDGTPLNAFTARMKAVSDAIFNPAEWKAPIYARCSISDREWVKAAVIWYHGQKPIESGIGVYSYGYAA